MRCRRTSESAVKAHTDEIIDVITTDPDLNVREAAEFQKFNAIRGDNDPKHSIQNLDTAHALGWSAAYKTELKQNHGSMRIIFRIVGLPSS
jgi:hypothetical protein